MGSRWKRLRPLLGATQACWKPWASGGVCETLVVSKESRKIQEQCFDQAAALPAQKLTHTLRQDASMPLMDLQLPHPPRTKMSTDDDLALSELLSLVTCPPARPRPTVFASTADHFAVNALVLDPHPARLHAPVSSFVDIPCVGDPREMYNQAPVIGQYAGSSRQVHSQGMMQVSYRQAMRSL